MDLFLFDHKTGIGAEVTLVRWRGDWRWRVIARNLDSDKITTTRYYLQRDAALACARQMIN